MKNKLSDIEVKADVFRIIRNMSDSSAKDIGKEIKKHFKDIATKEQIRKALLELSNV